MSGSMEDLVYVGIGLVAVPLTHGERRIGVHLPGQFPHMRGEVTLNPGMMKVSGRDAQGQSYNVNVETNSVVSAEWWPEGHNQLSAPLVQTGQRVKLWRNAKTDTYLWQSANMDPSLSVQETVVQAYAAKGPNGKEAALTPENSYMTSFSTANKEITLKTSKANGEPVAFDVQINTKDGIIIYRDDKGNVVQFDAVNNHIRMENANKARIDINKNNIEIEAPDRIFIKAGKQLDIEAPNINVKNDNTKYQSNGIEVSCPLTKFLGMVEMGGFATTGAAGTSGDGSIKGDMQVQGNQNNQGSLSVGGKVNLNGGHSNGDITGLSYRK